MLIILIEGTFILLKSIKDLDFTSLLFFSPIIFEDKFSSNIIFLFFIFLFLFFITTFFSLKISTNFLIL